MKKYTNWFVGVSVSVIAAVCSASAQDRVTWEQVLADPGNQELNLAFAQQRLADGDLVAAAATLERLLFGEPNWDDARLLYAGVLYRLGDYAAAGREMDLLDRRELTAAQSAQLASYRSRLSKVETKTRFSGRFSAGVGYDENAATLTTEDVGGDFLTEDIDQFSFVVRGSLKVEHDISESRNRALFAQLDYYTKQFEDAELDGFMITTGRGGLRGSTGTVDYKVNLAARNVNIRGDNYLNEIGVEGSVVKELGARTAIGAAVSYFDQEFETVFGLGDLANGRTGDRIDASVSLKHAFNARTRGLVRLDVRDKSADIEDFAYTFTGFQIGADHFFTNAAYLDGDVVFRDFDYEGSFGGASGDRDDQFTYARLAAGLPLSVMFGANTAVGSLPLSAELAVNHTNRESNVDAFEFDSTGAELRLIWKFGR